uniref:Uncharacterized protein n=1 Tax=Nelumbo nucifera TaxID=4432 RepID=A0A822Z4F7_NELNU|nr:TPA_asm: hypothetical protein HUJ06_013843 [Nelumbo nucifera]
MMVWAEALHEIPNALTMEVFGELFMVSFMVEEPVSLIAKPSRGIQWVAAESEEAEETGASKMDDAKFVQGRVEKETERETTQADVFWRGRSRQRRRRRHRRLISEETCSVFALENGVSAVVGLGTRERRGRWWGPSVNGPASLLCFGAFV